VKAVPNATDEAIAEFLHKEIFVNYGVFNKLVSNNGRNLLSRVVEVFIKILKAKHRTTTPSHPQTNRKNENLNGLLGRMLIKYLVSKPTRL
jgi:transposase InsO family protein